MIIKAIKKGWEHLKFHFLNFHKKIFLSFWKFYKVKDYFFHHHSDTAKSWWMKKFMHDDLKSYSILFLVKWMDFADIKNCLFDKFSHSRRSLFKKWRFIAKKHLRLLSSVRVSTSHISPSTKKNSSGWLWHWWWSWVGWKEIESLMEILCREKETFTN